MANFKKVMMAAAGGGGSFLLESDTTTSYLYRDIAIAAESDFLYLADGTSNVTQFDYGGNTIWQRRLQPTANAGVEGLPFIGYNNSGNLLVAMTPGNGYESGRGYIIHELDPSDGSDIVRAVQTNINARSGKQCRGSYDTNNDSIYLFTERTNTLDQIYSISIVDWANRNTGIIFNYGWRELSSSNGNVRNDGYSKWHFINGGSNPLAFYVTQARASGGDLPTIGAYTIPSNINTTNTTAWVDSYNGQTTSNNTYTLSSGSNNYTDSSQVMSSTQIGDNVFAAIRKGNDLRLVKWGETKTRNAPTLPTYDWVKLILASNNSNWGFVQAADLFPAADENSIYLVAQIYQKKTRVVNFSLSGSINWENEIEGLNSSNNNYQFASSIQSLKGQAQGDNIYIVGAFSGLKLLSVPADGSGTGVSWSPTVGSIATLNYNSSTAATVANINLNQFNYSGSIDPYFQTSRKLTDQSVTEESGSVTYSIV